MDTAGIVNFIFSLDEFSPLQPISRGQSGMYEREKRKEAPLSRLFSVIISTILIKLTIPFRVLIMSFVAKSEKAVSRAPEIEWSRC
jgi:hypothetical protein